VNVVLDSSAVLAFLNQETGVNAVREILEGTADRYISTVSCAEVLTRLVESGLETEEATWTLDVLPLVRVDFDFRQAQGVADLRSATRPFGLSFGDRACLALAAHLGATAVTANRLWASADFGVEVQLIR